MPTYNANVSGTDFKTGSVISIEAKAINEEDTLSIEFLNKGRASGSVLSASANELEVEINLVTWRLRPHAPSDGTVHDTIARSDATYWTVQTKV